MICSARGPQPVKIRPCRPSVSQADSDAGLPERCGSRGCDTEAGVSVSRTENMTFATAKNPLTRTPVSSSQNSSSSPTTPSTQASRRGRCLPSQRVTLLNSTRNDLATIRIRTATSAVVSAMTGQIIGVIGSMPKSSRVSFCQPTCCHTEVTVDSATKPTSSPSTIVRARPFSVGISRYFQRAWPPAPSP